MQCSVSNDNHVNLANIFSKIGIKVDRFEAMTLLVKVAETGSFSAAGRALNVPLPTISRKIADLETLLGAPLLIRTTRKLSLTDAGVTYVAAARRILEQVDAAERAAAGEFLTPKGELVLTAPIMFGRRHVLPVVAAFLAAYDAINIRLILSDRNVDLIDAHIDLAIRIGRLADSAMVAAKIGDMRTVVCASPSLLDRGAPLRTPDDLTTYPCVAIETPLPTPAWQFSATSSAQPIVVAVSPRLSVTTPEAAVQAAILGVGVTRVLHYQAADAIRVGALRILLDQFEPPPVPVSIVHATTGPMPLKMRHFWDFAIPRLRADLEQIATASSGGTVRRGRSDRSPNSARPTS